MADYLKNKKVKTRFKEDIEPQEILLDSLAKKREEEFGISEKKLEVPLSKKTFLLFYFVFLILILFFFGKTLQFQILEHKNLRALAESNKFIIHSIQAARGVIYDSKGKQLVFNIPSFDLLLNKKYLPKDNKERLEVLDDISSVIGKSVKEIEKIIAESKEQQILIYRDLEHQKLILLEAKINSGKLPGFQILRNFKREYKDGPSFSHIIGYTGKINVQELRAEPEIYSVFDYVGRAGIEKYYEKLLRRNPGKMQVERDALGNIVSKKIIQLPQPGKSLLLWVDSDLQKKIEEELRKITKKVGSRRAAAVALNPKTGGVLALVSLPTFDNNLFAQRKDIQKIEELLKDPQKPLFNQVISGRYPTGSTIKPLIASAALQEKIISPKKKIDCKGKIIIPNPWNPELFSIKKDWTVHGWTDMRKAIAESCNVYFYTIGGGYENQDGLGPTRIKKYLELFSWNEITGIDLPGEVKGFIPDKEWKKEVLGTPWWDGDTYNLAIGQGFLQITPLEVATAFSVIANGGKLLQPQILNKVLDQNKNIIEIIKPKVIRQNFIDAENLQIVREGMRQAVTGENSPQASATLLNSLPLPVAAKTGTAELGNNYYHNWVTVFAPYDDPKIVLTIVIENVKETHMAALPVAKNVLDWYFNRQQTTDGK